MKRRGLKHVLVPVAVLENKSVASDLMNLLSTMDVTVLGYLVLPVQPLRIGRGRKRHAAMGLIKSPNIALAEEYLFRTRWN